MARALEKYAGQFSNTFKTLLKPFLNPSKTVSKPETGTEAGTETEIPPPPPRGGDCGEKHPQKPEKPKREPTGNSVPELRTVIKAYTTDDALQSALEAFREMRERIRKPLTGRALELVLQALDRIATDTGEKTEIVNQSVRNSWQDVYPLKKPRASPPGRQRNTTEAVEEGKRNLAAAAAMYDAQKREGKQRHASPLPLRQ
jgi:hypothetical protein